MIFEQLLDTRIARRSTPVRKAIAYSSQPFKKLLAGDSEVPTVLVNSIPKSGTHLLLQIARALPGTSYFGTFVSQVPSISLSLRSSEQVADLMRDLTPSEVVGAHIYFSHEAEEALRSSSMLQLFVYRDPRAIALSTEKYLANAVYWNKAGRAVAAIGSTEERQMAVISGLRDKAGSWILKPLSERISPYVGWAGSEQCLSFRFEDLVSDPRSGAAQVTEAFNALSHGPRATTESLVASIDPAKSHTFRSGSRDEWRSALSPRAIAAVEDQCAEVLCTLGYSA